MVDYRGKLEIDEDNLREINAFLLSKENPLVDRVLKIIEKYGGVDEINRKAKKAANLNNLMNRLRKRSHPSSKTSNG